MKIFGRTDKIEEYGTPHAGATKVEGVVVVGYDPAINKWLALEWDQTKTIWLVGGGKENHESYEQAAIRELREETGYSNFKEQVQLGGPIIAHYYNDKKAVFRRAYGFAFLFILGSTSKGQQELEAHERFTVTWLDYEPLHKELEATGLGVGHWLAILSKAHNYLAKNGVIQSQ